MNCFLTSVQSINSSELEKAFMSAEHGLFVTTSDDGGMKVYNILNEDFQLSLAREFKDHQAPIMSVQFAPITHNNYLLSVGYDKTINLYQMGSAKGPSPVFSFTEEGKETGFFTCAAFVPCEKNRLAFMVGTANGTIIQFDSRDQFEPRHCKSLQGHIKCISASKTGEILVSIAGRGTLLYTDDSMSSFIEFGKNFHTSLKVSTLAFGPSYPFTTDQLFLTAGEDEKLGIWRYDANTKQVELEAGLDLGGCIVGAFWNLSGFSLNAMFTKKEKDGTTTEMVHISKALEGTQPVWTTEGINIIS